MNKKIQITLQIILLIVLIFSLCKKVNANEINYMETLEQEEKYNFSKEEIDLICKCIECEAKGQSFESKTHIASVIINRLNDERFPNNINDVITQPSQFVYKCEFYDEENYAVLRYVIVVGDTTDGALYFNVKDCNSWASKHKSQIFTDDAGHIFYK